MNSNNNFIVIDTPAGKQATVVILTHGRKANQPETRAHNQKHTETNPSLPAGPNNS